MDVNSCLNRLISVKRRLAISVFLQIIILVLITMALGVLVYTGATGLMSNWFVNKQVMVSGAYSIGNNVYVSVRNSGNVPIVIDTVTIYATNGTSLGSSDSDQKLEPGKAYTFVIDVKGAVTVGDTIDVYIKLSDGEVTKVRLVLQ